MKSYRQSLKNKKKDELPGFLENVTTPPEDLDIHRKPKASSHYLGPIFFGLCSGYQYHAPPHSLKLGSFHQPQLVMFPGTESVSKLLYPKTETEKQKMVSKGLQPRIKRRKTFRDVYPHKSPGTKKMFVPEVTPHIVDIGKSPSIIEGEASVEIPFSRYPPSSTRFLSSSLQVRRKSKLKPEKDLITLSDIREQKRMYMSYKERIAHAHFPKEFATVRVIGPPIPASITITKLPSKRKTDSELNLELKRKTEESKLRKSTAVRGKSTDMRGKSSTARSVSKVVKKEKTKSEIGEGLLVTSSVKVEGRIDEEEEVEEEGEGYEDFYEGRLTSEEEGEMEEAGEDGPERPEGSVLFDENLEAEDKNQDAGSDTTNEAPTVNPGA